MAKKKLSKSGRTTFTVENIDWPFIMEALEKYEKYVDEAEFPENSLITKPFVKDRVASLLETFKVEREENDGAESYRS